MAQSFPTPSSPIKIGGVSAVGARVTLLPEGPSLAGLVEAWCPNTREHLIVLDGNSCAPVGVALGAAMRVADRSDLETLVSGKPICNAIKSVRLVSLGSAIAEGWVLLEEDEPIFCICRRPEIKLGYPPDEQQNRMLGHEDADSRCSEWWVECVVCSEWFHPDCVGTSMYRLRKTAKAGLNADNWRCPLCIALLSTSDVPVDGNGRKEPPLSPSRPSPLPAEGCRSAREERKMRDLMVRFAQLEAIEAKKRAKKRAKERILTWRKELRAADPNAWKAQPECCLCNTPIGPMSAKNDTITGDKGGVCVGCKRLKCWVSERSTPLPSALRPALSWKLIDGERVLALTTLRHLRGNEVALGAAARRAAAGLPIEVKVARGENHKADARQATTSDVVSNATKAKNKILQPGLSGETTKTAGPRSLHFTMAHVKHGAM